MNNVGVINYNNIEIQQGFSIINSMKKLLKSNWFAVGLVIIATIIVYHNSLNAPFIFDDIPKIVENPDIQKLSNLKTKLIYKYNEQYHNFKRNDPSRPLVYLTFTLNYYFGKLNPFGYHLFNLIIHIFNAILVFFLAKKIISVIYEKGSTPLENVNNKIGGKPCGANGGSKSPFCNNVRELYSLTGLTLFPFLVSLLFAIHPINTNTVTYIFSRSDLLATFFYISSVLLFIKATDKNLPILKSFNPLYILSLICFILAIFSKQIAVTLPAIILIYDYIFINNYKISKVKEGLYYHIPYWLLFIGYLAFRYFYFGGIGDIEAEFTRDRYSYLIIQPYIILKYLKLLFIPIGLSIHHFVNPLKLLELRTIISFLSLIVIFYVIYLIYKKKTNTSKLILFSILWFFIILSPTSSIFPTTSPLVENRLYLSGIGFFIILVFVYFSIFKSFKLSNIIIFPICIYILLLGYCTIKRNYLYQYPLLLWQNVILQYPNNTIAHNSSGNLLFNLKRYEEAEREYREAIRTNANYAEAYYNLGLLLKKTKRYEEAEKEYRRAIRINTNHVKAHNNLGVLLYNTKRYEEAEKEYRKAIEISPNYIEAHNNLGVLLYNTKRYEEAEKECKEVIKMDSKFTEGYNVLGSIMLFFKRYEEAEKEYRKAIEISPNYIEAHNNLGTLYYMQKEYKKALREFEIVLKLSPNDQAVLEKINILRQLVKE